MSGLSKDIVSPTLAYCRHRMYRKDRETRNNCEGLSARFAEELFLHRHNFAATAHFDDLTDLTSLLYASLRVCIFHETKAVRSCAIQDQVSAKPLRTTAVGGRWQHERPRSNGVTAGKERISIERKRRLAQLSPLSFLLPRVYSIIKTVFSATAITAQR